MAYKKRAPRFDWQALIAQQQESGIPVAYFCRDNQLSTSAFYYNRVKLSKKSNSPVKNFITAQIVTPVMELTPEQFKWLLSIYDVVGHQGVYYDSVAL